MKGRTLVLILVAVISLVLAVMFRGILPAYFAARDAQAQH